MPMEICVLASGSSGNATYISSGRTRILIDCGLVACQIERRLAQLSVDPRRLDGIFITHAHTDHFRSAGTMQAKYGIPVFTEPATEEAIREKPSAGSFHRVKKCRAIPERVGDLSITAFAVPHGGPEAGGPVGFVIENGGKKVGHVTDCGSMPPQGLRLLQGSDALVLEANYDPHTILKKLKSPGFRGDWPYLRWVESDRGHLSNVQCAEVLVSALADNTKAVFPAHVSENHTDQRRDNNSFGTLSSVMMMSLLECGHGPKIVRTFRRDKTEGRASELVRV
jgi:phosphoribosyl 1,2-cyclic phosphodiesterase